MDAYQYRLLIGGLGDDAHSVGIRLLELGFREAGFFVKNIGIRNSIETFFRIASHYDIILISNKNGHSELYLDRFPELQLQLRLSDDSPKLWYLGGSLSVSESDFAIKKRFLNLGFTNVYPRPIVFQQVLHDILRDIHRNNIRKKYILSALNRPETEVPRLVYEQIIDRQWTKEELQEQRKEVLQEWPTGEEVLNTSFARPAGISTVDNALWLNGRNGKIPLLQPRTGVADINEQIDLLQFLEKGGSDISSVQLDSASRSRYYEKAALGRDISLERKGSVLNGFPVPIYGVSGMKKLTSSLQQPFQLRGGGPDHRFSYEIALSGGASAVEGGFICYLFPMINCVTLLTP
jgi:methylaspartate mutase epsilon subunit